MPKITRDNDLVTVAGDPEMQPRNVRSAEEGEQPSVGMDSSTLPESQPQSEEWSSPDQSSLVPMMESQSPLVQEVSDTADSADGETTEQEQEPRPRSSRRRGGY